MPFVPTPTHRWAGQWSGLAAAKTIGTIIVIALFLSNIPAGDLDEKLARVGAENERLSEQYRSIAAQGASSDDDEYPVGSLPHIGAFSSTAASSSGDKTLLSDETVIQIGFSLWLREPLKDPTSNTPKQYATIALAQSACSNHSPGWRLPKTGEFRALTKDGRINEARFPDFPIGAFWAGPYNRVAVSASGALDTYEGSTAPMVLCIKDIDVDSALPFDP
ncbi:hypothetical protein WMF26_50615 [Sorangium sp. So ce185]|uniref:hypothetical protein n=1 Tax=Sorangium sp. So ce185 TaxID=3133287 RepID=UPI003F60A4F4